MQSIQEDYNTQRELLKISEYGRSIQDYIKHIKTIEGKEDRTRWVEALVNVMATLNPEIKKQSNYQEVLWGHVYQISDFNLDIDSPYPLPTEEDVQRKPSTIGYPDTVIRFRFYGRNLQNMIEKSKWMQGIPVRNRAFRKITKRELELEMEKEFSLHLD